jgi:hypothetical protein
VNSEREFSFDSGIFGRSGSLGTQLSSGSGFGYGLTPQITLNAFLPVTFRGGGALPESRIFPGGSGLRAPRGASSIRLPAWASASNRRLRWALLCRARSRTLVCSPGCIVRRASPALWLRVSLRGASTHGWAAAIRVAEGSHDRRPDTLSWSAVYGYRPARLRRGSDQWDYRGFAELTGEHTGNVRMAGADLPGSSTTTLWLGPSVLAIFKDIAISGGVQAPLFRDASEALYGEEHIRFAINFSYLKYSSNSSAR